jgi:predicted TIM-barrel fold metal-dependent hydrolase
MNHKQRIPLEKIDLEAHVSTKKYAELAGNIFPPHTQLSPRRLGPNSGARTPFRDRIGGRMVDVKKERLDDMNATGVTMQVLSQQPACERLDAKIGPAVSKAVNDALAQIVEEQPDRFTAFAALAPQNPGEAADELKRAVKELNLKGWATVSNIAGTYLDNKKYWEILETAEKLGVPIYLHPAIPAIPQLREYPGMAGPAFGFTFETAMVIVRLIYSGVFEKYPRLIFMLGHLGEAMPFLLDRMDSKANLKLPKKPSDYFKNNVYVTTSGVFSQPALMCTYQVMGADRMLFATDYPHEDTTKAVQRIEMLPISQDDKEQIFHRTAQSLLHLR